MSGGRPYDEERFRAALVCMFRRGVVNRTKLALSLGFADFEAYRLLGESITGATYYAAPEGPWPRPFNRVCRELVAEGVLPYEPFPPYPRFGPLERAVGLALAGYALLKAVRP